MKTRTPDQIAAEIEALRLRIRRLRIERKQAELQQAENNLMDLAARRSPAATREEVTDHA